MIRTIKDQDYSKIPDLYADAFKDQPWADDWYKIDQFDEKTMWLYEKDHEILGFVISFISKGQPYVSVLAVRPSQQNKGIGQKLLYTVLTYWSSGYDAVYLHVDFDKPRAFSFYEKMGFTVESKRDEDYYMMRSINK